LKVTPGASLHNNTFKVTILWAQTTPKWTWQEWVKSKPCECQSLSIRPSASLCGWHWLAAITPLLTSSPLTSGCR
jgi:hypothetical protein